MTVLLEYAAGLFGQKNKGEAYFLPSFLSNSLCFTTYGRRCTDAWYFVSISMTVVILLLNNLQALDGTHSEPSPRPKYSTSKWHAEPEDQTMNLHFL